MSKAPEKRGRGRPRTGITPHRSIRMSDEDYAFICKAAAKLTTNGDAEANVSEFIRDAAMSRAKVVLKKK